MACLKKKILQVHCKHFSFWNTEMIYVLQCRQSPALECVALAVVADCSTSPIRRTAANVIDFVSPDCRCYQHHVPAAVQTLAACLPLYRRTESILCVLASLIELVPGLLRKIAIFFNSRQQSRLPMLSMNPYHIHECMILCTIMSSICTVFLCCHWSNKCQAKTLLLLSRCCPQTLLLLSWCRA